MFEIPQYFVYHLFCIHPELCSGPWDQDEGNENLLIFLINKVENLYIVFTCNPEFIPTANSNPSYVFIIIYL